MKFSHLQRLLVFTPIFLFFSYHLTFAQSEKLMTEMSKTVLATTKFSDKEDADAVAKLAKHPNAKDIHYFKMGNLANVQKNGLFDFTSPVTGKTIHAMTTRVEAKPNGDYYWYGTVSDTSLKGDMMMIKEKGKIYGHLNYGNESYQVYGLNNEMSAFVPSIKPPKGSKDCSEEIKSPKKLHDPSGVVIPRSTSACPSTTRILILYTSNAEVNDINISQTANAAFNSIGQALTNSLISVPNLVLAGVQKTTSFTESGVNNLYFDVQSLPGNQDLQTLKSTYNADIVAVLTNGNYVSGRGSVVNIEPTANNAFCIVEDNFAVTLYSFAHEIGHIYGGKHQNDIYNTPDIPYAHGFKSFSYYGTDYLTLMHILDPSTQVRMLVYSNPDQNLAGLTNIPYGTATYSNVSRRITETAQAVADYIPSQNFFATITGPTIVSSSGCYNYSSNLSCNSASSYSWFVSPNGWNYTNISSNSTATVCIFPSSQYVASGNIYLRLQVTSVTGDVSYAYWFTSVSNFKGIRQDNQNVFNRVNSVILSEPVPNPTNTSASILFSVPSRQPLQLVLFNALGLRIKELESGVFDPGEYKTTLSTEFLSPGLYFYTLTVGENSQTKKLLVSK